MVRSLAFFVVVVIMMIGGVDSVGEDSERYMAIETQLVQLLEKCKDKNIAMLTNPTSTDGNMRPLFDRILDKAQQYNITFKCFFAPEHGLRGDRQDGRGDEDYVDEETGIMVYSLYGVRKAPSTAQLAGVDILIYDIQDVGARYYTYIWTLTYTIEVLSLTKTSLLIFDRPNPLGRKVEGCPLMFDIGLTGRLLPGQQFSLPIRHGLTTGQFIGYLKPYLPTFTYEVIKMGNKMYEILDEEWVMSSPNMPTLGTVHVYAGMGLIEGTTISEGRGTTKPFQITGYPGINAKKLVQLIKNSTNIEGANYREVYTIPVFNKHEGEVCGGVQILPKKLTQNFYEYNSVETAINILKAYITLDPNITVNADRSFGVIGFSNYVRKYSAQQILEDCRPQRQQYILESKKSWLYPDITSPDNHLQQES